MKPGKGPPRNWQELHAVVAAQEVMLPRQLALLADFALQHPDIMAFGTCSSIARGAGVSPTTVSRLAAALGYCSFREMRMVFRNDLLRAGSTDCRRKRGKSQPLFEPSRMG